MMGVFMSTRRTDYVPAEAIKKVVNELPMDDRRKIVRRLREEMPNTPWIIDWLGNVDTVV